MATWWWPKARSPGTAILNQSDGVLLQELPFAVELKKFIVEHYSTGMPKLFASEIIIHDRHGRENTGPRGGEPPRQLQGIEIYQSSFDDGGSCSLLAACPWHQRGSWMLTSRAVVGGSTAHHEGRARAATA